MTGHDVASAGDVDGDGLNDILIGAPGAEDEKGVTYLVLGARIRSELSHGESDLHSLNADYAFTGESDGDQSGFSVAGGCDIDNDGLDDIFIGAPSSSDGISNRGKIYAMLGDHLSNANTPLGLASLSFMGEGDSDLAGLSLRNSGDVNGDGYCDPIIPLPGSSDQTTQGGKLFLTHGNGI